jgi:hypothetical protein
MNVGTEGTEFIEYLVGYFKVTPERIVAGTPVQSTLGYQSLWLSVQITSPIWEVSTRGVAIPTNNLYGFLQFGEGNAEILCYIRP